MREKINIILYSVNNNRIQKQRGAILTAKRIFSILFTVALALQVIAVSAAAAAFYADDRSLVSSDEDSESPPELPWDPTPEPDPEQTPELTPEPTSEPDPEQTPELTPEPTSEPTPEPIPEPIPEPTSEPTPEPTPEPGPGSVPDPAPESTTKPAPTPENNESSSDGDSNGSESGVS